VPPNIYVTSFISCVPSFGSEIILATADQIEYNRKFYELIIAERYYCLY
jgi:hypothetical protein